MTRPHICAADGCDIVLSRDPRRKTSYCRRHAASIGTQCPVRNAKIAATVRAIHAQPGESARRGAKVRATFKAKLRADPTLLERYREIGRRVGGAHGGKNLDDEARARATRKSRNTRLAHIPLEYRDEYIALERKTGMLAAERAQVIADRVAADLEKFIRTGVLPKTGGTK